MSQAEPAVKASAPSPAFRPTVIAPTYNNDRTLLGVLEQLDAIGVPVLAVNDGSTDATPALLTEWAGRTGAAGRRVIHHEVNRGKAAALLTGFAAARAEGFTHAATIDTDGQLDPAELPRLLEEARVHPASLIVGARDERVSDYPWRSRLGRRLSNLMVRLECGEVVHDSQCGFRIYPLALFGRVRPRAGRYAFETEIITLASWAGFGTVNVPVTCRYMNGSGGPKLVSHFRVGRETRQAVAMHARLLARRWLGRRSA